MSSSYKESSNEYKNNKKKIVDTIAAVYILESYINKQNK